MKKSYIAPDFIERSYVQEVSISISTNDPGSFADNDINFGDVWENLDNGAGQNDNTR